ncbi:MAG: hypothetical protein GYB21_19185 [Oceanospirillales bacterium]|nr:hypothetical protein [Oceanospirillales bacterium]
MSDHIAKPIDPKRLAEVLYRWVPAAQARQTVIQSHNLSMIVSLQWSQRQRCRARLTLKQR